MSRTADLGEIRIDPPITGVWKHRGFPKVVWEAGVQFVRSDFWTLPQRGVCAQYRQAVRENAAHLHVLVDGSFRIDHLDEANPDQGEVVQHFIKDTPVGKGLGPVACVALGVVTGASVGFGVAALIDWLDAR